MASAAALTKEGFELFIAGQLEEAASVFSAAIEKNPDFIWAYYGRGVTSTYLGNEAKAYEDFSVYGQYNIYTWEDPTPRPTDTLEEARNTFREYIKRIETNPFIAVGFYCCANLFMEEDIASIERAFQSYEELMLKQITFSTIQIEYHNYALNYDDRVRLLFLNRCIQQNPDEGPYFSRGQVFMKMREYEKAITDFTTEIEKIITRPTYPPKLMEWLRKSHHRMYSRDRKRYRRERKKSLSCAYRSRAESYEKIGRITEAKLDFEKAYKLKPSFRKKRIK